MTTRLLLVEDDGPLGGQIEAHFAREGFSVRWVRDAAAALGAAHDAYALVVLDLGLPDLDGFEVLRRVRASSDVPVLVLTARDDPRSRVRGLELGADDYVTKPFWPEELVARVKARLRRPQLSRDGSIRVGPIAIDRVALRVTLHGVELELTPGERAIIFALAQRPGAAITRLRLAELALDPDRDADPRALDVHVSRLRKKLGDAGACVETVRGIGYRLRDAGES